MRTLLVALAGLFLAVGGVFADNTELALKSEDKLSLLVSGIFPEDAQAINHVYPVAEDGTIAVQYIDHVAAAGLKPSDLARKIEGLFNAKEIYAHPSFTVSVDTDVTNRPLYVSGEVVRPGPIPYRSGLTVSKAVTSASGPNSFADMKKVKLKRNGKVIRVLNLLKAESADGDVLVEPDDEVVVTN